MERPDGEIFRRVRQARQSQVAQPQNPNLKTPTGFNGWWAFFLLRRKKVGSF
jgi:hypothetical protein